MVGYPSLESKWGFALWLPTNFGNDLSHIADRPLDTFIGEGGGGAVQPEIEEEHGCEDSAATSVASTIAELDAADNLSG